jgi:hypothetical protein
LIIEPFDNAIRHGDTPFHKKFIVSNFRLPLGQMAKNDLKEPAHRLPNKKARTLMMRITLII